MESKMTNTERLRTFVELMSTGQFDTARAMVHPEMTILEPPDIPYGGRFDGLAGFDEFRSRFAATWSSWKDSPMWYAENGDTVVKWNRIQARNRTTGIVYETPLAEFFTFRDGLIVAAEIFYQDVTGLNAAARAPGRPIDVEAAVKQLLAALGSGDEAGVLAACSDSVVLEFPYLHLRVARDDIATKVLAPLAAFSGFEFSDLIVEALAADPHRAVARYRASATVIATGAEYDQQYVTLVDVDDEGRITSFVEHFDTRRFHRALSGGG